MHRAMLSRFAAVAAVVAALVGGAVSNGHIWP
jgi:hypothetical protein